MIMLAKNWGNLPSVPRALAGSVPRAQGRLAFVRRAVQQLAYSGRRYAKSDLPHPFDSAGYSFALLVRDPIWRIQSSSVH